MQNKRKIVTGVLLVVLVCLVLACSYFYHTISTVANSKKICDGVHVDGVDVGGLSREEALDAVVEKEDELLERSITITYEDHQESVPLSQLGYSYADAEDAVIEAYKIGKDGSMWKRYKAIKNGAGKGTNISVSKSITEEAFQQYIDERAEKFVKVARNAEISRENGAWVITDEEKGMEVPVAENVEAINTYLNDKWDYENFSYELQANVAEPEYTREDMEKVTDVLGTYTTSFTTSTSNRITNIRNACAKIDGSVVYPGETFSVMDKIAPLTRDNGYLQAGSYSSGEVIQSYGGGVCQVATTLYNAVLQSELEVTERHNHQMVVSYVDLSFDAAVSDSGNQDFRFVNSWTEPIYIEGYVNGYTVTFTIYGEETRDVNRKVEYVSEKLATIKPGKDIVTKDKTMEEGKEKVTQSAHTGYRSKLWKKVYVNGELESTTEVNSSYYAPSARRVTVGTKKKETTEEEKTKNTKKKQKDTEQTSQADATTAEPAVTTQEPVQPETTQAAAEVIQ
ncbi:MAG: VanW family protein [Lachnospiraceae bacterium]|nr:VanW family protein [Lachnospiraceae bacterium]